MSLRRVVCTPRPLTSRPPGEVGGGGDLVDLVDVDDAVLREVGVAVGAGDEVAHEVFHVAADVARLAELRGVRLDEGHADEVRDVFDEVRLADARRAEQDDVALGVFEVGGVAFVVRREPADVVDVVVVVADGDGEHFLRLVLPDDETVEVRLDVARLVMELENVGRRASASASGAEGAPSAVSGWVKVLKETRSPKLFLRKSPSLRWISSGRGKRFVAPVAGIVRRHENGVN